MGSVSWEKDSRESEQRRLETWKLFCHFEQTQTLRKSSDFNCFLNLSTYKNLHNSLFDLENLSEF